MRAADGWRAVRQGIALGLTAGLVAAAVGACGGPAPTQPDARSPGSRCQRLSLTAWPTSSPRSPMTTSSPASSPGSRLVLYPDAGHGFLFQDGTPFASRVESFLTGHASS
jgi:pimeloyl-ACP methyl ester carboxylesterase